MTKSTKWPVHPAKTQISLGMGIHPGWSESLLSTWKNLGSSATHWVHSEDSDQTGQMPRLIWVFAGHTYHFVGFVELWLIPSDVWIFQILIVSPSLRMMTLICIEHLSAQLNISSNMGRAKRIWYLSPMRAAKVQASLHICAVSPEPQLLTHTSCDSRGAFRQKARSMAPLNGWACAVKICHDGMLEDTNSLDAAHTIVSHNIKIIRQWETIKPLMNRKFHQCI